MIKGEGKTIDKENELITGVIPVAAEEGEVRERKKEVQIQLCLLIPKYGTLYFQGN